MQEVKNIDGKPAGYSEVYSMISANDIAREHGAGEYGVSLYPGKQGGVFACYYFDAQGLEIGYWMPDFSDFIFCKGRKWHDSFKRDLIMYKL